MKGAAQPAEENLLRFVICGGDEDGKSTLVDRLLHDTDAVPGDRQTTLEPVTATGVADHRFATARRKFIVADAPGHERHTRDMVTGASTADLAVVLIDARRGLVTQSRRHSYVARLLGIDRVVVAVNKMDLVGYAEPALREIEQEYRAFAAQIGVTEVTVIPLSALRGDNVAQPSAHMPWYGGPTLLAYLESSPTRSDRVASPVRTSVPGELPAASTAPPGVSDRFEATIVWMAEQPMLPGRPYLLKCGTHTVTATIARLKHKINVNTLEKLAAQQLERNEIGVAHLGLNRPLAFDPHQQERDTGAFILIDLLSNDTVGIGALSASLRRAEDLYWQALDVGKSGRAAQKNQKACVLWFTGLSGAGKSTIANLVEKRLFGLGRHTYLLDGDNVRHGLCRDLGFSDADRVENIRRVGEVARLMTDAGLIVLVSFISPFRSERRMARALLHAGEFIEIFVDTALQEAERRDPKGLYRRAREGKIRNFTGIDSPYEPPEHPEIRIDTEHTSAEQAALTIIEYLRQFGVLERD